MMPNEFISRNEYLYLRCYILCCFVTTSDPATRKGSIIATCLVNTALLGVSHAHMYSA